MQSKSKIGSDAAASKNRALFVVAFMIALLASLYLYFMLRNNKAEIQQITGIYDGLIKRHFDANKKNAVSYYKSLGNRLLADNKIMTAIAKKESQSLGQLTKDFIKTNRSDYIFLREINWHIAGMNDLIRNVTDKSFNNVPTSALPLIKESLGNGKIISYFISSSSVLAYHFIIPVLPGNSEAKPGKPIAALELIVDTEQFLVGLEEELDLGIILLITPNHYTHQQLNPFKTPSHKWQSLGSHSYYSKGKKVLISLAADQEQRFLQNDRTAFEISHQQKTYLLHHGFDLLDARGKPAATLLWTLDITQFKAQINTSFYHLIITSASVLMLVFLILYFSFGRLINRLVSRDHQLESMNNELQAEITDRNAVERELKTHRDHLEELIAEGTMELEIKSQEIEANEMKLRTVTSSIQDAIIMVDHTGKILFWNKATERIFGYDPDEIRIKNFFKHFIPTGSYAKFIEAYGDSLKTGNGEPYGRIIELECLRENGEVFPVELLISEVKIQDNPNLIALIRDISLKIEEETQKRIMLSAVEQSNVGIQIADTRSIIVYVNPKFSDITGYSREEVVGQKTNILKSHFNPEDDYRKLWETITAGKDWQGELYNRKKNGDLYWDSSLISPIKDPQGNITHYVAVKEDITERKNLEVELLTAKDAAEAASRSKGEFLANMSHEIRTPMNAIMGMTELALGTDLTEEQREYLDIVSQASKSLLKLLNDILDFSKVDAGKLVLESKPFELRKSLGEMLKTLALQAHEKELELVYYIDSEVPDNLLGDVGRLRQIVVNLIGNAIKFTETGEIVLKIDVLEDNIDNKILLHFIISDTGIGIPEDRLNFIFEKFAQADSSNTRKYGGTGLGLAISAKLVELMGGVIWAESPTTFIHSNPDGPGSTFHFTGLFEIGDQQSERKDKEALSRLKGLSVLIVDDNETNRRFLQEIMAKSGLRPETANSGTEALELLQNESRTFQLVILDFQMPGMNGATVLKKIRTELLSDIAVILITSGVKAEDLLEFKAQKASSHLLKPVSSQELFDVMLKVMGYKLNDDIPEPVQEMKVVVFEKHCMNILVAEDNAINQRLIRRLLEKEGHRVDIASDGKEAVKTFIRATQGNDQYYHLILMDIQMPNMDGMEATRKIRQIHKTIPIIALTAHAMKGDKVKFLAQGMNDYVSKPIDKKILFDTIEKHVIGRTPEVLI
jgi:two-component system, sensor histidine kinase and response regulator